MSKYGKPVPLEYGCYYHIYNQGINRQNLFFEDRNYRYFLKLYAEHILPVADTFAYCLLPNHFHLLVRIKIVEELKDENLTDENLTGLEDLSGLDRKPSQHFSNLFNAYTKAINKAYQRSGSLFKRPFGRVPVTDERYFVQLITYIHQNPQKHGLMDDFRTWPYSSYATLLSTKPTHLKRNDVLQWFDGPSGLEALHRQTIQNKEIALLVPEDFA